MHCVAGDGVGILAGALVAGLYELSRPQEIALEYILGFGFGWAIFQALFMRDMAGGSYVAALRQTFMSEFLSMNCLMAGMVPVAIAWRSRVPAAMDAGNPAFWFIMSIALLVGFMVAYPMNWWLVTRGLKHGMMTVRRSESHPDMTMAVAGEEHVGHAAMSDTSSHQHAHHTAPVGAAALLGMAIVSLAVFAAGLGLAAILS